MDIRPNLGVRVKLAAKGSGLWQESAGDKSVFGLNAAQVVWMAPHWMTSTNN